VSKQGRKIRNSIILALFSALLSNNAGAEGFPCWIRCRCPPKVTSAADVPMVLRLSSNPPLSLLARTSGILTTYLGKVLGIQGWKDYRLPATVKGKVVQAAASTDLLYTIDLRIEELHVDAKFVALPVSPTFIRVEVFPFVRIGAPLPLHQGDEACVSGALMWDADGFMEIHPKNRRDFWAKHCQ
jgi:hypothetical protein